MCSFARRCGLRRRATLTRGVRAAMTSGRCSRVFARGSRRPIWPSATWRRRSASPAARSPTTRSSRFRRRSFPRSPGPATTRVRRRPTTPLDAGSDNVDRTLATLDAAGIATQARLGPRRDDHHPAVHPRGLREPGAAAAARWPCCPHLRAQRFPGARGEELDHRTIDRNRSSATRVRRDGRAPRSCWSRCWGQEYHNEPTSDQRRIASACSPHLISISCTDTRPRTQPFGRINGKWSCTGWQPSR
jgi:hypothetical protein